MKYNLEIHDSIKPEAITIYKRHAVDLIYETHTVYVDGTGVKSNGFIPVSAFDALKEISRQIREGGLE